MTNDQSCRELLLLRHGKSTHDLPVGDFDRPLTDKGIRHVHRIGSWCQQHDLTPDLILSSPAQRALQTAQIMSEEMDLDSNNIHFDEQIYNAYSDQLLDALSRYSQQTQRILLVGHNPSLETLADYLIGDYRQYQKGELYMRPSTLLGLQTNNDWANLQQDCARLTSLIHPQAV